MRPALCEDALRLGRILAELAPREPEVHGLVALMEIQASRSRARVGPSGEPILLFDQNRAHWDQLLIRRGLAALDRAESCGPRSSAVREARTCCRPRSPPVMRGRALRRKPTGRASWTLYAELAQVAPSPVVELNRAVAVAMAFGPAAGLELVDALTSEPSLKNYHLLPSVRGDLLKKLGRLDEARAEFERAAALTRNARERELSAGACPIMHATPELTRMGALSSSFRFLEEADGLGFFRDQDKSGEVFTLIAFGVPSTPEETQKFATTRKEGGARND